MPPAPPVPPGRRPRVVAQRGHLPDLPAQLRRRERRRRWAISPACASTCRYLADLGVDAIWFTPWYDSPLADGGYDVARLPPHPPRLRRPARGGGADPRGAGPRHPHDHRHRPEPRLATGTVVPAGPRRRSRIARARAVLVPARPRPEGRRDAHILALELLRRHLDPHHRTPTGRPASGTCTCSARSSPTSTGTTPTSAREHEDILRFWFDRGVAGVRIDSAALLVKDPALPEVPEHPGPGEHPNQDRDELHDIYRSWRPLADAYPGTRVLVGEVWLPDIERFAEYLRPDELHTAFNFDFLARPWDARELRASIDETLAAHAPVHAPSTWVLSNHDVTRAGHPLRPGGLVVRLREEALRHPDRPRARHCAGPAPPLCSRPRCPARSTSTRATSSACRRSKTCRTSCARTRCTSAPAASTPAATAAGCRCRGAGTTPPFGFSPDDATAAPWLPQPADWAGLTVRRSRATRRRCCGSTARRCASAAQSRHSATAR